jgi:peptidoglycan/LPS O-acetylase OafA/YrhL
MGWQPSLDGLRAVSVAAVILYHAGFSWAKGGFIGVEVFFVISGFLITSLLIDERDTQGAVSLRDFWARRWRRLLPALVVMMVVIAVWVALFGNAEQQSQIRRDLPWGLGYLANWGQIVSDTSYFGGSPTVLRHLWSLAVEEQWYVIWPLAFILLGRRYARDRDAARVVGRLAMLVMLGTAIAGFFGNQNFLYLSTITRSSGLLLGAALAYGWKPWRFTAQPGARTLHSLDRISGAAVVVLAAALVFARVDAELTYIVTLPAVTAASAVLIAMVVHPRSGWARWLFSSRPLVVVGQRSYGLYLWSWPISQVCGAYDGSWSRFALAMAITVPVSEACYRYVEKPVRQGALGAWWRGPRDEQWRLVAGCALITVVMLVSTLTLFYRSVTQFDRAAGGADAGEFDATVAAGAPAAAAQSDSGVALPPIDASGASALVDTTLDVVIVGDSQAHSLAVNLPDGVDEFFEFTNGATEGCGVHTAGFGVSSLDEFRAPYSVCSDVPERWARSAEKAKAEVALVMLGAWDVLDLEVDGQNVGFANATADQYFLDALDRGVEALKAQGVHVALLEVPCMRPVSAEGAVVPPLPARGDDARVAHLNELLRGAAAADPQSVTFVTGPPEWCADSAISADTNYRWDGVHVYKPGAKMIIEEIAPQLLALPR